MTEKELMKKIQEISFAKLETQLVLDTHPTDTAALGYFHNLCDELSKLMDEYQGKYGAIVADGASMKEWNWISGEWPWQRKDPSDSSEK